MNIIINSSAVNKNEWHKWFAWYPVLVSVEIRETKESNGCIIKYKHEYVWLSYVNRKRSLLGYYYIKITEKGNK